MRFVALGSIASVFWASFTAGLFQDEAFQIDYQHALLGKPNPDNTFFHQPSTSSKATLLYSLSFKNVLGAINPRDGSLVWRQVLATTLEESTQGYLRTTPGASVVVTAVNHTIQSWDAADGRLFWQRNDLGAAKGLVVISNSELTQIPIVVTEAKGSNKVTRVDPYTGTTVWQFEDSSDDVPIGVSSSSSGVFYISLQTTMLKNSKLKATKLALTDGKNLESHTLNGDIDGPDSIIHVGDKTTTPALVWTDKALQTLKINVLGNTNVETIKIASKSPVETVHVHAPSSDSVANHFLVHFQTKDSHWGEVYHVDPKTKSVKKAFDLPVVSGKGAFSASAVATTVVFTRTTEKETLLIASTTAGVIDKWTLTRKANVSWIELPEISSSVTEIVTRGQAGYAVRSALTFTTGDTELFRNGDSEWTRHESLVGVVKGAFADIPLAENLAEELAAESTRNVLTAYIHRVKRHVGDLRYFPDWLQGIPNRLRSSLLGDDLHLSESLVDSFGFRKIVIVATERGSVAGLDTGNNGKVLWSSQIVDLPAGTKWNVTDISIENDMALIMAKDAEFVLLNVMTGQKLQYQAPGSIEGVDSFIAFSQGGGKRELVPVMTNGAPGGVPPGKISNNTFIVTRRWDGSIAGWHVQDGEDPTGAWIFSPGDGEAIAAVASRPPHDPVASVGRALGDRNVLYKYISENLLAVSTINDASSSASIHLLDTVTGETLYSTTHHGVDTSHPVSITFSENWFAYTLKVDPELAPGLNPDLPRGYLLTISELFESSIINDRGPFGTAANYSSLSRPPYAPHVATASYVVPSPLTHLTTTSTKQGITPRSILAYSAPLAAILAIPASLLSPRRPVGRDTTAGEKEEGLFPYTPLFDLNAQWFVSHRREVHGIQDIITSPTLMESSTLAFAYGELDLFGTRIAPIGTFDLLGKGFNKASLVITVVALAIGTRALAPMAKRKQINALWGQ